MTSKKYTFQNFIPAEQVPHDPGILAQQALANSASQNNERANSPATTGQVLGEDSSSGESLVRVPGNQIVRVSANQATPGSQVAITNPKQADYDRIRKQGTVTSNKLVENTGFSVKEDGRNTSTIGIQKSVDDIGLLRDPCTPPDVKARIIQDAAVDGIYVDDQGNYLGTQSFGTINDVFVDLNGQQVRVSAADATSLALDRIYQQQKAQGKQQASLPEYISLASLGGTTTEGFVSSDVPLLWKCQDGTCIEAADGFYPTKALCESQCGVSTWNCINGECVQVPGSTGAFKTQADCVAGGCSSRWTCIGGEPVPSPTGEYTSREQAVNSGCYWGYQCQDGECQPVIGGAFRSLACCQQFCLPLGNVTSILFDGLQIANGPIPTPGNPAVLNIDLAGVSMNTNNPLVAGGIPQAASGFLIFNSKGHHKFLMSAIITDVAYAGPFDAVALEAQYREAPPVEMHMNYTSATADGPVNITSGQYFGQFGDNYLAPQISIIYSPVTMGNIGAKALFDQEILYSSHVPSLISAAQSGQILEAPNHAGSFGNEEQHPYQAQSGLDVSVGGFTAQDLGSNLARLTWTNVEFTGKAPFAFTGYVDSPRNRGWYYPELYSWDTQEFPYGTCDGLVKGLVLSPGVIDPEVTSYNHQLAAYCDSYHWPEDWTQYSIQVFPEVTITGFLALYDRPIETRAEFTGLPAFGSNAIYPWATVGSSLNIWTDPKFNPSYYAAPGRSWNCSAVL